MQSNLELQTSCPLTAEQRDAWHALCVAEFPKEACAYIAGGNIVPVANVSANPTETFAVNPIERIRVESEHGPITGFLHSHPATPAQATERVYPVEWPTSHDMVSWLADDLRWGISWTDGEYITDPIWLDEDYIAPLEGRHFIHGIWDCYGAVRDWFRVHKDITLKNYPRGMDWWHEGEDLYSAQFEGAGFIEIDPREVVPGDCALMSIHSKGVICHAAVVHDEANFYHHTFSRTGHALSGLVPRSRWAKHISMYVRHVGLNTHGAT